MIYDKVFKSVLQDKLSKEYLIDIISGITNIPKEEFEEEIVFKNTELKKENNKEKTKIADLIIELDKSVINLEMNKKLYLGLIDKNDRYIYKIKEGLTYQGQKEIEFKRIIQINFDNYKLFGEEKILKFEMMNKETGIVRSDYVKTSNIEIYHVNLKKIKEMYYNKEKLSRLEKELLIMILDDEKSLKDIIKDEDSLKPVVDKIVTLSREEELQGIYIKEEQEEWIKEMYKQEGLMEGREEGRKQGLEEGIKEGMKEGMKEGRKEGMKEGINEGIKEGKQITALNLLNLGVDIDIIKNATGLTNEEINNLKNEK